MPIIRSSEQQVNIRLLGFIIILFVSAGVLQFFLPSSLIELKGFLYLWSFMLAGALAGVNVSLKANKNTLILISTIALIIALLNYALSLLVFSLLVLVYFAHGFYQRINLRLRLILLIACVLTSAVFVAPVFQGQDTKQLVLPVLVQTVLPLTFTLNEILVFGFSFLATFILGLLLHEYRWLSNYHFKFHIIQYWARLLLLALVIWLAIHIIGLYHLIANSFIGAIAIAIDFISIQFVICALGLYLLLYAENFRIGQKLNAVFEGIGRYWKWIIAAYLLLVVLQSNINMGHLL